MPKFKFVSKSRKALICLLVSLLAISIVASLILLAPTPLKTIPLKKQIASFRFPAEFEGHEAVWVGWGNYEAVKGYPIEPISLRIVEELVPFVNVKIPVCTPNELSRIKGLLQDNNIFLKNVSFPIAPCVSVWWRDFGPVFVVDEDGNKKVVDFQFNYWGYMNSTSNISKYYERADRYVAEEMGLETIKTSLVSEGGDREFNSKGTLIVTESVELQRNPGLSKKEIEREFRRVFGVEKVIWLKKGLLNDEQLDFGPTWGPEGKKDAYVSGGTGGHIDEYCRFVGPHAILLAEATEEEAKRDPIAREDRVRMEENFKILSAATDQDGNPFEIVRIPIPETEYITITPEDPVYRVLAETDFQNSHVFPYGQPVKLIPASSYCNFLITNGIVLVPKYWEPGKPESIRIKDEQAMKIIQSLFPERKVVAIPVLPLNLDGGGIHCCTQQEPAAPKEHLSLPSNYAFLKGVNVELFLSDLPYSPSKSPAFDLQDP
jgi:agmatine deiminase